MNHRRFIYVFILIVSVCFSPFFKANAGLIIPFTLPETDTTNFEFGTFQHGPGSLFYVFDLRDRETFLQLTFSDPESLSQIQPGISFRAHIQIFDVSNNCNENNFFDDYTVNDTHVYNMRDIQTNDGNQSGIILPEGSYGIVAVTTFTILNGVPVVLSGGPIGNQRILDNNGYEYRTNAQGFVFFDPSFDFIDEMANYYFNFNQQAGVSLSDVIGVTVNPIFAEENLIDFEWNASNVVTAYNSFDVDIYNLDEVPFSCRDVIFSCVDQDNPRLEELLETAGTASVASYEYGINNAIPHSKGGELLCPGNVVEEGMVVLRQEAQIILEGENSFPVFFGYIGLNNGNGRGSFDSLWAFNAIDVNPE